MQLCITLSIDAHPPEFRERHHVLKRLPGLDGLRGIAVISVVIYHTDLGIMRGGFLGVDIFFVLSGFLITTLLIQEAATTGHINRFEFYKRRIRRLVPALAAMVIVTVVIAGLWVPDSAFGVRRDLPWALVFFLNWSYINAAQSYFVTISRPPLFQHLWSLSIEEQFYVIWPLVVMAFNKIARRRFSLRQLIFVCSLSLAVCSTIWMSVLAYRGGFPQPNDPSRAYFGTDTHAMGLLIGCLTASAWDAKKLVSRMTPDRRSALHLLGLATTGAIGYFLFAIPELSPFLYHGGFLVLSTLTALLIVLTVHPALRFRNVFGNRILRWFGDRSYGMYIWHWPLFMLLRPGVDVNWSDNVTQIVRCLLLLVISDISYRYLELPIRQGVLSKRVTLRRSLGFTRPSLRTGLVTLCVSAVLATSVVGLAHAPSPDTQMMATLGGITSIDSDPTPAPVSTNTSSELLGPKPKVAPVRHGQIAIFGDSVVLGGRSGLQKVLGPISIDAAVSRQPSEIARHVNLRRRQGRLATDIVIHMGTNGPIRRQDLELILDSLRDRRRVVIVNLHVPRRWMKPNNLMIADIIKDYPNVRLADWDATSLGHREYFVRDGVHLTFAGIRAFASMIKRTLDGY